MRADFFYDKFKHIRNKCILNPESIDLIKGELRRLIDEMLFLYLILIGHENEGNNIIYILKMLLRYIFAELFIKSQLESKYKLEMKGNNKLFKYDNIMKF